MESEALAMSADHTHHIYGPEKNDLQKRLRRVEGQVRGIQTMMDEDRYCVDILVQIAAIKSALQQVGLTILESHTRGCVVDAISNHTDGDVKIDELIDVIRQFTKS
jgi:CsoR family transcriptional regulator, copper-sensing transcriptional repressor